MLSARGNGRWRFTRDRPGVSMRYIDSEMAADDSISSDGMGGGTGGDHADLEDACSANLRGW